jgi:hypothetical protein
LWSSIGVLPLLRYSVPVRYFLVRAATGNCVLHSPWQFVLSLSLEHDADRRQFTEQASFFYAHQSMSLATNCMRLHSCCLCACVCQCVTGPGTASVCGSRPGCFRAHVPLAVSVCYLEPFTVHVEYCVMALLPSRFSRHKQVLLQSRAHAL